MKINAVIFDFFGVIHEDPLGPWLTNAGPELCEQARAICHELDTGIITYNTYFVRLSELLGEPIEDIRHKFTQAAPISETIDLIQELKQSYQIGLITNTCSEEIEPILKRYGLRKHFDVLVVSSEFGSAKPDQEIFNHALQSLHVRAEQACFLDDNPKNVTAARGLGIHGIHFREPNLARRELANIGVQ